MTIEYSTCLAQRIDLANSVAKLPSPVKPTLDVDVIELEPRLLFRRLK
jgi:hypothetical protein